MAEEHMTPEETVVHGWLGQMGNRGEKLPEDPERKTCDFAGNDGSHDYLVG